MRRKAQAPHGTLAILQMEQWKKTAAEKSDFGFEITPADRWIQRWSPPTSFRAIREEMALSQDYHVMTPPHISLPLDHYLRHYDANRKTMRKGLRRYPDGRPDLRTVEGLYLAAHLALDVTAERPSSDASITETLAGLFVSVAAYQATLDRLGLTPADELNYIPYPGIRPPTADDLCRHTAACGITPWDVGQSLNAWARHFLASNDKSNKNGSDNGATPTTKIPLAVVGKVTPSDPVPPAETLAPTILTRAPASLAVSPHLIPLPAGEDMDLDTFETEEPGPPASVASDAAGEL
ncbi:hypothetical protein C8Q79DRAFT_977982 [Trametes meyenii]|nr:hypothetical protein C8Q79DRAFT_977982 [Trametes meyenii]